MTATSVLARMTPILVIVGLGCAAPDGQTGPEFGKAAVNPTVTSAAPASATQDTTLDVQVGGSGFDNRSSAQFLLAGIADPRVRANSTRYVSTTSLVANITIAADAPVSAYDVAVTTGSGKKGVGTELFAIKGKTPPPPADPRIAYAVDGSTDQLMVMNVDGTRQTSLYTAPFVMSPAWSPDGTHLAFGSGISGSTANPLGLYVTDVILQNGTPQASSPRLILAGSGAQWGYPSWSPTGDRIAMAGTVGPSTSGVYIIPNEGGTKQVVYGSPAGHQVTYSSWSPDGSRIAFSEVDNKTARFWLQIADVISGMITVVYVGSPTSSPPQNFMALAWSPDGSQLVFEGRSYATADYNLYTIAPIAGAAPAMLPSTAGGRFPSWSPSGSQIAYQSGSGILLYDMTTHASQLLSQNGTHPNWRR